MFVLLVGAATVQAAVITHDYYDFPSVSEAEFLNEWTRTGTGGWGAYNIHAMSISGTGGGLTYTRTDIPIDNGQAWMFEAVMSAPALGGAGTHGMGWWASFSDPEAPPFPPGPKSRRIEVRLAETGGGQRRFALVDGADGTEITSIVANWANAAERYRVRLRRQLIGTNALIFLEAQLADALPSAGWISQAVPLSMFSPQPFSSNEFGFGNVVPGYWSSAWDSLRVMTSDMSDTLLPTADAPLPSTVLLLSAGLMVLARKTKFGCRVAHVW